MMQKVWGKESRSPDLRSLYHLQREQNSKKAFPAESGAWVWVLREQRELQG